MRATLFPCVFAALLAACGDSSSSGDAASGSGAPPLSHDAPERPATTTPLFSDPTSSAQAEIPQAPTGSVPVLLDGTTQTLAPPTPGATRIAPIAIAVPVYAKPDTNANKIGFLRAGATVEADAKNLSGGGCSGGFRGIKPVGFVCMSDGMTEDLNHPIVVAIGRPADVTQKLPYMYGTVTRGGPVYDRIPTEADLEKFEPSLSKHIKKWREDEVSGADYGHELWFKWQDKPSYSAWEAWEEKKSDELPPFLRDHAQLPRMGAKPKTEIKIGQVDRKQGMSFVSSQLVDGRRYNVTPDLRVMPADRFRPIKGSDFNGVRIGVDVDFPFVIIRKKGAKKWTWSATKKAMIAGDDLAYRSYAGLTGKQKIVKDILHYETKDGYWVDDRHASRLDPVKKMPKWGKNGEKWMDINITKQTLVALEGEKAVYATLVSTGEDGLFEGEKATRTGIYRVHTKHISTTMDSDAVGEEFELRDVPYVQYFEGGYALHAAYWHDSFGTPKSHGCINLAPEDARRLFFWTEPQVPQGWHSALKPLTGTILFVHP